MMTRLSVVILTFNQAEATLRCLASLAESINASSDEIIVVDNGSVDATASLVEAAFPHVDYIRLPHNIGVAAGRNRGIAEARGEYILILDNDTIANPEAIEGLMAHLRDNPQCGIAAPRLIYPDGSCQESFKDYPGLMVKLRNVLGRRPFSPAVPDSIIHPCYVMGACQMMRSALARQIGPLDENIFYGPEDADFCLRAAAAGFTIDYLPYMTIIHDHRHVTRRRILSPIGRRHIRGLLYFWHKHRRFL